MFRKLTLSLCALASAISLAASASAYTITSSTTPFDVYLGGNVGGTDYPDLTATATFSIVSWSGSTVVLGITIDNTAGANWEGATVSAIGFDTDPDVVSASSTGVFTGAFVGGSFPNNFGSVDVCAISKNNPSQPVNNCNGGNGGVTIGTSGSLQLTLSFSGPVSSIDLSNLGIRWQQLNSQLYGIVDGSGTGGEVPPIPEPSAAVVFGIGALILGASRARR
jgi:hypothetical protein